MDVASWLDGLGLGQYADAFRANDIDVELLAELSEADLERLGGQVARPPQAPAQGDRGSERGADT